MDLGRKKQTPIVYRALRGTSTTTSYYDTDKISDASGDKLASGGNFLFSLCLKMRKIIERVIALIKIFIWQT